jgi:glycerophosphoryl diester phosphodiesterase
MPPPFRLYGHRGAAAHHPENTLRSFRAALAAGADAIETDVRLSSDGEVVIFHDASGERTCGQQALLRASPWSVVSGWDAGLGERPVRLLDLLEEMPEVFFNVDIKDDDPEAAVRTVEVVRRMGAQGRVGLGSFHVSAARAVARTGWTGQMALVPREVAALRLLPRWLGALFVRGNAAQIPTHQGRFRLDPPWFIARCHEVGLRVDYWTIDDPAEAVSLVRAGADGIVSNDPGAVGAALREAGLR